MMLVYGMCCVAFRSAFVSPLHLLFLLKENIRLLLTNKFFLLFKGFFLLSFFLVKVFFLTSPP